MARPGVTLADTVIARQEPERQSPRRRGDTDRRRQRPDRTGPWRAQLNHRQFPLVDLWTGNSNFSRATGNSVARRNGSGIAGCSRQPDAARVRKWSLAGPTEPDRFRSQPVELLNPSPTVPFDHSRNCRRCKPRLLLFRVRSGVFESGIFRRPCIGRSRGPRRSWAAAAGHIGRRRRVVYYGAGIRSLRLAAEEDRHEAARDQEECDLPRADNETIITWLLRVHGWLVSRT